MIGEPVNHELVKGLLARGKRAVNRRRLFVILDLNDGRSDLAKRKAAYRFCARFGIKKLPGELFPLGKIERVFQELADAV